MVEVEYFLVLGTETVTAVMTEEEEGVCLGDSTGEREGEGDGSSGTRSRFMAEPLRIRKSC